MTEQKSPSTCVVALRCSRKQRAELERRAAGRPIGPYLRTVLFPANDNEAPPQPTRTRAPAKDAAALAKALALLGPAATTLKFIAHGIASGALPLSPDTEAAVLKACADIRDAKALLMKALGIRER